MEIFKSIQSVFNEYDAWASIAMIVADKTAVNIGKQNGFVVKPQFISCQHHVLDLTIKHVLNYFIEHDSQKHNMECQFIGRIVKNYNELQDQYNGNSPVFFTETLSYRADLKYLNELCKAFNHYKVKFINTFITKCRQMELSSHLLFNCVFFLCRGLCLRKFVFFSVRLEKMLGSLIIIMMNLF